LEHLPYAPDFSLPDYFSHSVTKSDLKGWFVSAEEVSAKSVTTLIEVWKNGFQKCFRKLMNNGKSVFAQGNYFEGNVV
jgi:predicted metal-binding protein